MKDVNVINFPLWRKNCTAAEKLCEVAQYAKDHPEDFKHVIIIWEDGEGIRRSEVNGDMLVSLAIYLLEQVKYDMLKECDACH